MAEQVNIAEEECAMIRVKAIGLKKEIRHLGDGKLLEGLELDNEAVAKKIDKDDENVESEEEADDKEAANEGGPTKLAYGAFVEKDNVADQGEEQPVPVAEDVINVEDFEKDVSKMMKDLIQKNVVILRQDFSEEMLQQLNN